MLTKLLLTLLAISTPLVASTDKPDNTVGVEELANVYAYAQKCRERSLLPKYPTVELEEIILRAVNTPDIDTDQFMDIKQDKILEIISMEDHEIITSCHSLGSNTIRWSLEYLELY